MIVSGVINLDHGPFPENPMNKWHDNRSNYVAIDFQMMTHNGPDIPIIHCLRNERIDEIHDVEEDVWYNQHPDQFGRTNIIIYGLTPPTLCDLELDENNFFEFSFILNDDFHTGLGWILLSPEFNNHDDMLVSEFIIQ